MRRGLRECLCKKVFAYLLVCCVLLNASLPVAFALQDTDLLMDPLNPDTGVLGTAWGPSTVINTDHGAVINWKNFNTIAGESVEFRQFLNGTQDPTSAVLNQIHSGNVPTQFNGALTANGRVFVVNPAGIVFGRGSTVNVTQLVASGLNLTNFEDVLTGGDMEFGSGSGEVTNHASINADSVHLVGKKVMNASDISTPVGLGPVVLAAGDNVYIAQDGSNVVVGPVAGPGVGPDVLNVGKIKSLGGTVVLAASDNFGAVVNNAWITVGPGTLKAHAARVENGGTMLANGSFLGDAGSITLSGVEEVTLSGASSGNTPTCSAHGFVIRNAGTITLESSEGSVNLGQDSIITAHGGSTSGDGGYIKITGEHFTIDPSSVIDASPQNQDYAPGTLEIDPPIVTIANGSNVVATEDTIYEQDIETLSRNGTNIIVRAEDAVNVQVMTDDGEITGGIGGIELHATSASGSVSFANTDNIISTTQGNITISAGSEGINIGSLETGQDSAIPGSITLSTTNGGDIAAQNLAIREGWGHAEISADASGSLTVSGDVAVGREAAIENVPDGADAEAIVNFNAGGVVNVGAITAASHGSNVTESPGVTRSHIYIKGGADGAGNVNINGNLFATAISADSGTADATIEIHTPDSVFFAGGVDAPLAIGDNGEVEVQEYYSIRQEISGDVAEIIINEALVQGIPDFGTTHMGTPFTGNVLDNDGLESPTASLATGPEHDPSFTLNADGSYIYNPPQGYVGDDTFTYTATVSGSESDPVTVTITMTNTPPEVNDDVVTTYEVTPVAGNVLENDKDEDPLKSSLVSGPANDSAFQLNEDGSFSYTPAEGFVGTDSFTYSASDPEVGATPGQATVTITVNAGPSPTPKPTPTPTPTPTPPSSKKTPPPAPGVNVIIEPKISGTPALVKWVAEEIGVSERVVDVWFANTLASAKGITPVDSYSRFKKSARILQDTRGRYASALSQVIDEFASSTAPPTEEQMASIAEAISVSAESDSVYALAGEYVNSLENYVAFLVTEMDFSQEDAVAFVTNKYVDQLAAKESVGLAAYVAARLADIFTDSVD